MAKDKTQQLDGNHGKAVSEVASSKSARHVSQQLMNNAILAAQEEVSLNSGNEPMSLLYRAAIEAINEELAPYMGENALQQVQDQQIDTSPEPRPTELSVLPLSSSVSTSSKIPAWTLTVSCPVLWTL